MLATYVEMKMMVRNVLLIMVRGRYFASLGVGVLMCPCVCKSGLYPNVLVVGRGSSLLLSEYPQTVFMYKCS